MTEITEVENPLIRFLDKYKINHRKMNGMGQRGWPDQLICLPLYPLWLELKRKGEKLRKLQVYRINQLRELGYEVEVYDTAKEAIDAVKKALERRLETAQLSKESGKAFSAKRLFWCDIRSRIREDEYKSRR